MTAPLHVQVRCFAAPAALRASGVRCFAQVVTDETLFVDGLTVRVTEAGHAVVTWPERKDGQGRLHAVVRILDDGSRAEIEAAVFAEAVRGGWLEQGRIRAVIGPSRSGGAP